MQDRQGFEPSVKKDEKSLSHVYAMISGVTKHVLCRQTCKQNKMKKINLISYAFIILMVPMVMVAYLSGSTPAAKQNVHTEKEASVNIAQPAGRQA